MANDDKQSSLIEIGALWYSTKTPGVMSGNFGNRARIVVIPNKFKEKDNQPDMKICIAPNDKPQQKKEDDVPW